jgi:hypothetical protein
LRWVFRTAISRSSVATTFGDRSGVPMLFFLDYRVSALAAPDRVSGPYTASRFLSSSKQADGQRKPRRRRSTRIKILEPMFMPLKDLPILAKANSQPATVLTLLRSKLRDSPSIIWRTQLKKLCAFVHTSSWSNLKVAVSSMSGSLHNFKL